MEAAQCPMGIWCEITSIILGTLDVRLVADFLGLFSLLPSFRRVKWLRRRTFDMRRFAEIELMEWKDKRAVTFLVNSQHSRATMLASRLVVAGNKNKGLSWKQTGPDWDFHYLMLDHLSNCNISPRQICPFMLCEFWVGLFYSVPNPKLIFRAILVNRVIQKWAITYTNMTQSSFWPKAPYFPVSLKQVIFTW